MGESLVSALRSVVGDDHVLVDDDLRAGYEIDWTGRWSGTCAAVVRPASTHEVAGVVQRCASTGTVVIPQAGNTGLVGGSVPRASDDRPSIVLSTRRLVDVGDVDPHAMQVTLGAGITIAEWREHAEAAGLDSPLDFAARDTATIGGAIATNAGGSRVLRFGTMRQQVVGMEAVLANGEVVGSLAGLPKETLGLHWPSVLTGSEGTLGVITSARLRLVPAYPATATALLSLESIEAAVELLAVLRRDVPSLDAVEVIEPGAMELVAGHLGRVPPIRAADGGTYLMVDCAAQADPADELLAVLDGAAGLVDTAVATDRPGRAALVELRDRITESIATAATALGRPVLKLDVAVPVGRVPELLGAAHAAADGDASVDARLIAFGHLAEGNLHLNYLGVDDPDPVAEQVLGTVARLGGTISAEHGVGIAKVPWLGLVRSDADLAARRAVKQALDPQRILNPGVLGL